jgi:hypothetical protein
MSFNLIDKLKAVRDAYERHPTQQDRENPEAEIKSLNNMIKQELYKMKKKYKKDGNHAMVNRCDQELQILMGKRLFEAESLVPSGILDAVPSPSTDPSLSLFAFRGGPQPASFAHGFYDTFKPDPNSEVDDAIPPLNPFSGNPSQFPVFVSAQQLPTSSRRGTAAKGRRGGNTRKNKSIRRRKH